MIEKETTKVIKSPKELKKNLKSVQEKTKNPPDKDIKTQGFHLENLTAEADHFKISIIRVKNSKNQETYARSKDCQEKIITIKNSQGFLQRITEIFQNHRFKAEAVKY